MYTTIAHYIYQRSIKIYKYVLVKSFFLIFIITFICCSMYLHILVTDIIKQ